jgi:hypothetical protein
MSSDIIIKSLSNDQVMNDQITDNIPYDYTKYMCVFENAGAEIPPEYFGMLYTLSTDFKDRKKMCETTTQDAGAEAGLYIERTDWIDPTEEYVCGIFNASDGTRMLTDKGDKRQFPSKKLCDMYNSPRPDPTNNNIMIQSKMVTQDIINPVTDYNKIERTDDGKSVEVRTNVILVAIILTIILYLFYVLRFQVQRPYSMYDITKKLFLNRTMCVIIAFGIFIYVFCPFGMCYTELITPAIIRNPEYESYALLCDNLQHFRGKRTSETLSLCDNVMDVLNSSKKLAINPCNNLLKTIDKGRDIYYNVYKQLEGCSACLIEKPCIERQSNHLIQYVLDNNIMTKKCVLCDKVFCKGDKCYPGKESFYLDKCPKNKITEHEVDAKTYKKTEIEMQCKHCKEICITRA